MAIKISRFRQQIVVESNFISSDLLLNFFQKAPTVARFTYSKSASTPISSLPDFSPSIQPTSLSPAPRRRYSNTYTLSRPHISPCQSLLIPFTFNLPPTHSPLPLFPPSSFILTKPKSIVCYSTKKKKNVSNLHYPRRLASYPPRRRCHRLVKLLGLCRFRHSERPLRSHRHPLPLPSPSYKSRPNLALAFATHPANVHATSPAKDLKVASLLTHSLVPTQLIRLHNNTPNLVHHLAYDLSQILCSLLHRFLIP